MELYYCMLVTNYMFSVDLYARVHTHVCTDARGSRPASLYAVMDSFDTVFGNEILLLELVTGSTFTISRGGHNLPELSVIVDRVYILMSFLLEKRTDLDEN